MTRLKLVFALVLVLGCADGTQQLPDAAVACGPVAECATPIESTLEPHVEPGFCQPEPLSNGPLLRFGSIVLAVTTVGCERQWVTLSGVATSAFFGFGVSNCCETPRFLKYLVPGPVASVPAVEGSEEVMIPEPGAQPMLATYTLEDDRSVLTPACRFEGPGDQGVCSASTACAGEWRLEVPPGKTVQLGFMRADLEALLAPDDFLPDRLVAYLPRLEESPDASPTLPASATLCLDDPLDRFDCYDCPTFTRPDRLVVDLTQAPGVPEAVRRIFIDAAE